MIGTLLSNIISFPGLGIGPFPLDPVAFRIPLPWTDGESHSIMWYGIIITLAMIVGFIISLRKAKYEGIKTDDMFDLAIYLIIFCMIGARLYYVLSKPDDYDSFYDVIAIWNGGLAIYGGIIAGALTIVVYSRIKKIKTAKLLDAAVPGLIIGQAIGRWGNFFNAEAHGTVTDLPWRMGIIEGGFGTMEYYHPTFLYESLWNLLGFIIVMCLYKKKKFDGRNTLFYLVWYGVGRYFIEGLRTDSLYLLENVFGQTVRVSQLVSLLCVIGGVALTVVGLVKAKRRSLDEEAYDEVYASKKDALVSDDTPAFEVKADTVSESDAEASGENTHNIEENKEI